MVELLHSKKQELIRFLKELISIPSVTGGGEREIQEYLKEVFSSLGLETELVPFPPSLKKHQEYIPLQEEYPLHERKNLIALWNGEGKNRNEGKNIHRVGMFAYNLLFYRPGNWS